MKSIIKSVQLNNNVVTIVTKSNVIRTYILKSNQIAMNYYNSLTNWIRQQLDNNNINK